MGILFGLFYYYFYSFSLSSVQYKEIVDKPNQVWMKEMHRYTYTHHTNKYIHNTHTHTRDTIHAYAFNALFPFFLHAWMSACFSFFLRRIFFSLLYRLLFLFSGLLLWTTCKNVICTYALKRKEELQLYWFSKPILLHFHSYCHIFHVLCSVKIWANKKQPRHS